MEIEIASLQRRLQRSKVAIFAVVFFLVILTFAVVFVSKNLSQQAMTYQSSANEIIRNNNIGIYPTSTIVEMTCEDMLRKQFPCVNGIGMGDYYDENGKKCARNFNVSCYEDKMMKVPQLPDYCWENPGYKAGGSGRSYKSYSCRIPEGSCISVEQCDRETWEFAASICGCRNYSITIITPTIIINQPRK